jgi:hypothetical protein
MNASNIRLAFERHQQRQKCLNLCGQILDLITHIQQHRGATLAILAGDDFFETRLNAIKPRVLKNLQDVQALRTDFITNNTWETLCAEWFTVNNHWRHDNAFHNFELHTHLIQQLLKLFRDFCDSPIFQNLENNHARLAKLTLQELPELMETTAQIRGIGTHCLVSGDSDKVFTDRLGFLKRYFSRITDHLNAVYPMDKLLADQSPWYEIMTSWSTIESQLSSGLKGSSNLTADSFFNDSSLLVFQTKQCIKIGIKRLKNATDTNIQEWIQSSSLTSDNIKAT